MATKDSIMKQSIFFWVFGHRLSFEYGLKKFLFGAWRNLSGALRELILSIRKVSCVFGSCPVSLKKVLKKSVGKWYFGGQKQIQK